MHTKRTERKQSVPLCTNWIWNAGGECGKPKDLLVHCWNWNRPVVVINFKLFSTNIDGLQRGFAQYMLSCQIFDISEWCAVSTHTTLDMSVLPLSIKKSKHILRIPISPPQTHQDKHNNSNSDVQLFNWSIRFLKSEKLDTGSIASSLITITWHILSDLFDHHILLVNIKIPFVIFNQSTS